MRSRWLSPLPLNLSKSLFTHFSGHFFRTSPAASARARHRQNHRKTWCTSCRPRSFPLFRRNAASRSMCSASSSRRTVMRGRSIRFRTSLGSDRVLGEVEQDFAPQRRIEIRAQRRASSWRRQTCRSRSRRAPSAPVAWRSGSAFRARERRLRRPDSRARRRCGRA